MEIHHRFDNDVLLIKVSGRFDAPSAPEAERTIKGLLQEGTCKVVLDLTGVEYISSGGLRVVIMLSKTLERANGELRLCGLSPFVSEVFDITNLSKRYSIHGTVEEAIQAFQLSKG